MQAEAEAAWMSGVEDAGRMALARLQRSLDEMPPVAAMGIRIVDLHADRMRLDAPLQTNRNDKGCAFGGSLTSIMTLSCWSLCAYQFALRGLHPEIYVQDSSVRYLAPVYEDLHAEARVLDQPDWEALARQLKSRGRVRATLAAHVFTAEVAEAATMEGRFVAILPDHPARKR